MVCKNCGEKLIQIPGKRAKEFCDSTCRSNYWQIKNRLGKSGYTPPSQASRKKEAKAEVEPKTPKIVAKKEIENKSSTGTEPKPGSMAHFLKYGRYE